MDSRHLRSEVAAIDRLPPSTVARLYELYEQCYDGADRIRFEDDLREKPWIILLRNAGSSSIAGFSTQMIIDTVVDGRPVRALFSGDTVIQPAYWGSQELVRAWCRLAGGLKAQTPNRPLYWFLISKGYRTYLYLPYFFHCFYPNHVEANPPFVDRLIATLGSFKYPEEFNRRTGLIEHRQCHDRLKPDLDATARHQRNPHVAFFLRRNPDYRNGTELLCVAEIALDNMRSMAKRELAVGLCASRPSVIAP